VDEAPRHALSTPPSIGSKSPGEVELALVVVVAIVVVAAGVVVLVVVVVVVVVVAAEVVVAVDGVLRISQTSKSA